MKPAALVLAVAVASAVLPGCAALQSADVLAFVQKAQTKHHLADEAVKDITESFAEVLKAVPESSRAAWQKEFDAKVNAYRGLSVSLSEALSAVAESQKPSPDVATITRLLVQAARGVFDVVRTFGGPQGVTHAEPDKMDRADETLRALEGRR